MAVPNIKASIIATASQIKNTTLKSISLKAAATGNAAMAYKTTPNKINKWFCSWLFFKKTSAIVEITTATATKKMGSKNFILLLPQKIWGGVVENVRTVFERRNDATIYIPALSITPTTV